MGCHGNRLRLGKHTGAKHTVVCVGENDGGEGGGGGGIWGQKIDSSSSIQFINSSIDQSAGGDVKMLSPIVDLRPLSITNQSVGDLEPGLPPKK